MQLTEKYRPRRFQDVIGNSFTPNKSSVAFVLEGEKGTGKTSTARILAAYLNCPTPDGYEPCGKCDSCQAIFSDSHLDVVEVNAAANNGVDFARDLATQSSYSTLSGNKRIYILDEAQNLTKSAFDVLLKPLESNDTSIFILCTTSFDKFPDTIKSRTTHARFRPIRTGLIVKHLEKIASTECLELAEGAIAEIAASVNGSLRQAVTLISECDGLSLREVKDKLGQTPTDFVPEVVRAIASGDYTSIYNVLSREGQRYDISVLLVDIAESFRACLLGQSTALKDFSADTLVKAMIVLKNAEINYAAVRSPQLFLETVLLEISLLFNSHKRKDMVSLGIDNNESAPNQPTIIVINMNLDSYFPTDSIVPKAFSQSTFENGVVTIAIRERMDSLPIRAKLQEAISAVLDTQKVGYKEIRFVRG